MLDVKEIESAVACLSADDLVAFRAWSPNSTLRSGTESLKQDASSGRLNALADEAIEDLRAGRATDL